MRAIIFALALIAPTQALAVDDLCVEAPANNQLPTWWNNLPENVVEARFANATELDGGRVVWDALSGRLLFEVTIDGDNSLDEDADFIAIGLSDGNGNPSMYIEVQPMALCATEDCSIWTTFDDVIYSRFRPSIIGGGTWSKRSPVSPLSTVVVEHAEALVVDNGDDTFDTTVRFALRFPHDPATGEPYADQRIYMNVVNYTAGPTSGTVYENALLCESVSMTSDTCTLMDWNQGGDIVMPNNLPIFAIEDMWPRVVTGPVNSCP